LGPRKKPFFSLVDPEVNGMALVTCPEVCNIAFRKSRENVILHNGLDWCTMLFWRVMDYWPEPGVNLIGDWYDLQEDDVRAEFDVALLILSSNEDWIKIPEFNPLRGKNAGLYEILIDIRLPREKKKRHFRPIGIWRPDSRDFILLLACEKRGKNYDPPLDKALEYKADWEQHEKGEIREHNF